MRFSENWLREWVDPAVTTEELSHQLTMAGLEVDAIDPAAAEFTGVVVGKVLSVVPHPDADKLRVCKVDVGAGEPLDIVCGAPNVHEGMLAPTAVVGAVLPGGFKIKKAKLRGAPSHGMLCSAKELGLSEASEGLMPLPGDSPVGRDLREYLGLDDRCIELGLTPNRSDCLGVAGIAREVGVLNGMAVKGPAMEPVAAAIDDSFPVDIDAPADCPRYVGRVIRGVNPAAPTPLWMRERLRRSGLRSLGPLVDVTNYVLLELGQPMHAFDLAKLAGGIRVRRAAEGEKLELLNEQTVTLSHEDLVIADANGPVALAGIMGGEPSSVGDDTCDVFLESAFFSPASIAGRARSHGLHTDSSHRFERGVDPHLQRRALERASALLLAIGGGQAGPVTEVVEPDVLPAREPVRLRSERLARVLGAPVENARVVELLHRLEMQVASAPDGWTVTPPSFRFDIAIEEDLIEEVGRIVGYSSLPSSLPVAHLEMAERSEHRIPLRRLRAALLERGYQEAITYSFVDPKYQQLMDPEGDPVRLANPISADLSVMRTGLWPGLAQALVRNVNRQQGRVRLFETGLRFVRQGDETAQEPIIGGIAYGSVAPEQWGAASVAVDFFDVKGDVEALLARSRKTVEFRPESHPALHPGQSARIHLDDEAVGWLGALHPAVQKALDLPARAFVFEVALEPLQRTRLPQFTELSRFPAIRRDLALVVGRDLPAARVLDCIRSAAPDSLRELKLFDVYAGERIDSGRKSLAIGLTLQEQSRTLTDDEVDAAIGVILDALREELGATLRE